MALKVRSLHPDLSPEEGEARLTRAFIEQLADKVTAGFGGDVRVVPRQFLRTFANILDIVATEPDQDPFKLLDLKPRDLTPEERQ